MSLKNRAQAEYEILQREREREEKRKEIRAGYEKIFLVKENNMEEVNRILRDGGRVKKIVPILGDIPSAYVVLERLK